MCSAGLQGWGDGPADLILVTEREIYGVDYGGRWKLVLVNLF